MGDAAESQVWLDFALAYNYISQENYDKLNNEYHNILGMLVNMSVEPEKWKI